MGTVVNGNATGMSKKGGAMLLRWKGETHVAANASVMTAAIILLCGTAAAAAAAAATACGTLPVVPLLPSDSKPRGQRGRITRLQRRGCYGMLVSRQNRMVGFLACCLQCLSIPGARTSS